MRPELLRKFFQYGFIRFLVVPILLFLFAYILLTWPAIKSYSSHFFCDGGDGLQNVWNIWWVQKALSEIRPLFWTDQLYHPFGTTLLAHTLNPFNGFLVHCFGRSLTPVQQYNFVVVFSFVCGGLTAFWLCWHLTRNYAGCLAGGYIFTFSSYHFAHSHGHLQLISLQWLPLFVVCWLQMLNTRKTGWAISSALALLLVLLCDYYYFFYCCLFGLISFLIIGVSRHFEGKLNMGRSLYCLMIFLVAASFLCGWIILPLFKLTQNEILHGSHDARHYSMDLLAWLIPGGNWRFHALTDSYYGRIGDAVEHTAYLGIGLAAMLTLVWISRKQELMKGTGLWFGILLLFASWSLGKVLRFHGQQWEVAIMPYRLLEWLFPPFRTSGVPVRMMIVCILSASILFAYGIRWMAMKGGRHLLVGCLLFLVVALEHLPRQQSLFSTQVPEIFNALKKQPGQGGVLNLASSSTLGLYYQTIYEKPQARGYISRLPDTVASKDQLMMHFFIRERFQVIRDHYGIQFVLLKNTSSFCTNKNLQLLFRDPEISLFSLGEAKDFQKDKYYETVEDYEVQGIRSYSEGNFSRASEIFRDIVEIRSAFNALGEREGELCLRLADCYRNLGEFPLAGRFYLQACSLDPKTRDRALLLAAQSFQNAGMFPEAVSCYKQYLQLFPGISGETVNRALKSMENPRNNVPAIPTNE